MGLLDANIPQMVSSQASFADQVALFQSTVHQAENSAIAAQATHVGESSMAFQQAHAQFVEVATKMNTLLGIAEQNIGDASTTYTLADSEGASGYTSAMGAMPTNMMGT
jgi:uncharacterized protein YukE